ncbi:hypothetical protein ACVI1L_004819 [Bradyrhizobium sp. USDA 4516]
MHCDATIYYQPGAGMKPASPEVRQANAAAIYSGVALWKMARARKIPFAGPRPSARADRVDEDALAHVVDCHDTAQAQDCRAAIRMEERVNQGERVSPGS